jgi:hypothetical protein
MARMKVTRRDGESDAAACRRKKWKAGTLIAGDEGYGVTVIKITAIGEENILARPISHDGEPSEVSYEGSWTLSCRDWKKVRAR